jgi:hypothetical protein
MKKVIIAAARACKAAARACKAAAALGVLFSTDAAAQIVLVPPITNQGNYATGCSGGTCRTFDDHWTTATLSADWLPGLYINGQYLDGGIGLVYPYSAWTIGNVNGGTETVFFDYPYGYPTNLVFADFQPLGKTSGGSLRFGFGFGANGSVGQFSADAKYVGGAISSAYNPATLIPAAGGLVQYRAKFDIGLNYGSYPAMQCSATGAGGASGTSYNANFEHGYIWTGTALTNVGMGMNNLAASSGTIPGATSETGVYQVSAADDLRNWHVFAIEYTGDSTKKWQYYVDGVLVNTVPANHPAGVVFSCSFQIFNSPSVNDGWHSGMSETNPPPFYAWVSDWQFYKRPGT